MRLGVDSVMTVGFYSLQCETTDGRCWEHKRRFTRDGPQGALVRKIRDAGQIETEHWRQIERIGVFNPRRL